MFSEIETTASNNWYKKAQINSGKFKITENKMYYIILGRNTKPGEGSWRVSAINRDRTPFGHNHFPTYEEALDHYNNIKGIEKNIYELV